MTAPWECITVVVACLISVSLLSGCGDDCDLCMSKEDHEDRVLRDGFDVVGYEEKFKVVVTKIKCVKPNDHLGDDEPTVGISCGSSAMELEMSGMGEGDEKQAAESCMDQGLTAEHGELEPEDDESDCPNLSITCNAGSDLTIKLLERDVMFDDNAADITIRWTILQTLMDGMELTQSIDVESQGLHVDAWNGAAGSACVCLTDFIPGGSSARLLKGAKLSAKAVKAGKSARNARNTAGTMGLIDGAAADCDGNSACDLGSSIEQLYDAQCACLSGVMENPLSKTGQYEVTVRLVIPRPEEEEEDNTVFIILVVAGCVVGCLCLCCCCALIAGAASG